tara:strand:- start:9460 stop:9669 length:210 start_codon:yes stop_codon:yes gene_type:complete
MDITRTSMLTGKTATINIPGLTLDMISQWEGGAIIQDVMPNVSPEHREFIMTGITPEEWSSRFPDDEGE